MKSKCFFLKFLKNRGFIFHISNFDTFKEYIKNNTISLYCGFDPTANSLHLGHLLPIMLLLWFQKLGHISYIVIGGATSRIGDPSFKIMERDLCSLDFIKKNQENIKIQMSSFFSKLNLSNNINILNNFDWFKNLDLLDFLNNIGRNFSVNSMINKDSVKSRLLRNNIGISFTEFSYSLLQAYDFLYLYKNYGVVLQIGGSDQWGNIVSGINLIKKVCKKETFGITTPLFVKSDGKKIGKTEKNTIWLNSKKTSPYKFYQFWMNIDDSKVICFLNLFTFIEDYKIKEINDSIKKNKIYILKAKSILASEVTRLVHGSSKLKSVKRIINYLFGKKKHNNIQESDYVQLLQDGIPFFNIHHKIYDLQRVLVESTLSTSRRQSRSLILSGSIKINHILKIDKDYIFSEVDKIFGKYTLLCKGKKNYLLLNWIS